MLEELRVKRDGYIKVNNMARRENLPLLGANYRDKIQDVNKKIFKLTNNSGKSKVETTGSFRARN